MELSKNDSPKTNTELFYFWSNSGSKSSSSKKKISSTEKSDHGSVESSVKTTVKIKEMMRSNSKVSLREIAEVIGVSTRAIEKAVKKLTEEGEIDHKGPKKGGEWIVVKP